MKTHFLSKNSWMISVNPDIFSLNTTAEYDESANIPSFIYLAEPLRVGQPMISLCSFSWSFQGKDLRIGYYSYTSINIDSSGF